MFIQPLRTDQDGMVRGSKTTSVLANLYADRFLGFGFLAVGYLPPNTEPMPEAVSRLCSISYNVPLILLTVKKVLQQVLGYW